MAIPFQNRRAPAGSPAIDAVRCTASALTASAVGGAIQPRTSGPYGALWLRPNQTMAPTASRPTAGRYDRRVPFPLINKPTPQPAPKSEPYEHFTVPVPDTITHSSVGQFRAARRYLPGLSQADRPGPGAVRGPAAAAGSGRPRALPAVPGRSARRRTCGRGTFPASTGPTAQSAPRPRADRSVPTAR